MSFLGEGCSVKPEHEHNGLPIMDYFADKIIDTAEIPFFHYNVHCDIYCRYLCVKPKHIEDFWEMLIK